MISTLALYTKIDREVPNYNNKKEQVILTQVKNKTCENYTTVTDERYECESHT